MKPSALQQKIMRRVYYAYSIAIASHVMFWQGLALGACIALFGRLTHVASIAHNFLAVPLARIPEFVLSSFEHAFQSGEVFTVIVSLTMIGLSVSFVYHILPFVIPYFRQQLANV